MQKKMNQYCHCEGAVGDCGNLNSHNMKTVYFLRRPPSAALRVNSATWQSLAQQAEKAPYRLVAESIVSRQSSLVAYSSEARPVLGRPVEIISSAFNRRQWNRAEMPAVVRIHTIITQNKTVMLRDCYFCKIK